MIRVAVESLPDRRTLGLQLDGHAGLAERGNDILCAAVSVLAENLGAGLKILLDLPVEVDAGNGVYTARIAVADWSEASELLFQSALLGLRVLREQYPERMTITSEIIQ